MVLRLFVVCSSVRNLQKSRASTAGNGETKTSATEVWASEMGASGSGDGLSEKINVIEMLEKFDKGLLSECTRHIKVINFSFAFPSRMSISSTCRTSHQ